MKPKPVRYPLPTVSQQWPDVRYEFDASGNPLYIGQNRHSYNASTSSNTWLITKYTFSGGDIQRMQTRQDVAWDDRASLF